MIANLVFYQRVLIALVWVFLMLAWLWPSEPAAARPREQGDAGGNCKTPVEWPALCTCHSNPETPPYACQTALVMCNDQGEEETVTDVITLTKNLNASSISG